MGLADELKRLSDLHASGALNDAEYGQAKARLLGEGAPAPSPTAAPASAPAKTSSKTKPLRLIVLVGVLIGILWLGLRRSTPQQIASSPVLSAAASLSPIDLTDAVVNLPANSLKGVPITLPYAGNLQIDVHVLKGNPVDVFLVDPTQIEAVRSRKEFRHFSGYEAKEATTYRRQNPMQKGSYNLILMDRTLGILSANASDIQVKVRLEP